MKRLLAWLGLSPTVALLGLTALGLLAGQWAMIRHYRTQALDAALARDSAEAAADTTRRILLGSLTLAQRRVIQVSLERDSLDRALKVRSVAHAATTLRLPVVDTVLVAVPRADTATFTYDSVPYHAAVTVAWTDTATAHFRFRADSIWVRQRTVCGAPVRGIRPATVAYLTPSWVTLTVDSAQQSPLFCQPDLSVARHHDWPYFVVRGVAAGSLLYTAYQAVSALARIF